MRGGNNKKILALHWHSLHALCVYSTKGLGSAGTKGLGDHGLAKLSKRIYTSHKSD